MSKLTTFLESSIKRLTIVFFAVMVLSALLQVFTRYVVNASIPWTDELARYTFIWSTMLGACLVHKRRSHVMIDVFVSRFYGKKQAALKMLIDVFSLIILSLLVVQGLKLLPIGAMQTTPALGVKMSYVMLSVPVSAAYMTMTTIEHLIADTRKFMDPSGGVTE